MWVDIGLAPAALNCRPPFSFYFDIVDKHWKTKSANSVPLHRICTLARKQGAVQIWLESAAGRTDVSDEINALDQSHGGGGSAEAISLSFFTTATPIDAQNPASNADCLGQLTLINYRKPTSSDFTTSYIYEAVLPAPCLRTEDGASKNLLNNFVTSIGTFKRQAMGQNYDIHGVYYSQQNGVTSVCAHASLKMGLNTLGVCTPPITSGWINTFLSQTPPFTGLSLNQIIDVTNKFGIKAWIHDYTNQTGAKYISDLAAILESGYPALLVFTTGRAIEHVVTVFGHTRNSDEWHPQALPAYSGPASAQYYPSSTWTDHFLIHDDNFGPYYTLSSRALEFDPEVKAHYVVGLFRHDVNASATYIEANASIILTHVLSATQGPSLCRWLDYITQLKRTFIMRPILIEKADYIDHIKSALAHDQSGASDTELKLLDSLPDIFWQVEFSLPDLYTGNRSKLGEVMLDATLPSDPADLLKLFVGMRLPSVFLDKDGNQYAFGIESHIPNYQTHSHNHQW